MARKAKILKKGKERELLIVNPDAAGIDISSTEYQVCVPEHRDKDFNRRFDSYTCDLHAIARWLKQCRIKTIAMEATGIYWIQIFLILQDYGFDVILVNAKHIKNIAGKKTDVVDASWIQILHSYGLLEASFQPDNYTRQLRNITRHRENLVRTAARTAQHMQKALEMMNVKVHKVISDILGKSGISIINAILSGERNASKLALYADSRVKASREEIIKSLEANWSNDQLFILKLAYENYIFIKQQIGDCDKEIQTYLNSFPNNNKVSGEALIPSKKRKGRKNDLNFDGETLTYKAFGVNLERVPGISNLSVLKLLSELGSDFTNKFPDYKRFTSWANVVPHNKISGGKVLKSYVPRKKNHVGNILRMAASTLRKSNSALGNYFRKIQSRQGYAQAVVATAHKLARIIYTLVSKQIEYDDNIVQSLSKEALIKKLNYYRRSITKIESDILLYT
jgi:transposase